MFAVAILSILLVVVVGGLTPRNKRLADAIPDEIRRRNLRKGRISLESSTESARRRGRRAMNAAEGDIPFSSRK